MVLSATQVLLLASTAAAFAAASCEVDGGDCPADGALHEVSLLQKDLQLTKRRANAEQSVQVQMDGIVDNEVRQGIRSDSKSADSTYDILANIAAATTDMVGAKSAEASYIQNVADTTTTQYNSSNAAAASGVKTNGAGDLLTFITATITNIFTIAFCVGCFMFLKERYPLMYQNNLQINKKLTTIDAGLFGWVKTALKCFTEEGYQNVIEDRGLDMALYLKFIQMSAEIMWTIGLPMFLIMGPINCLFGGHAAGEDHLSYLSFGNVVNGSQLYWIHALVVWGVVLTATHFIFKYEKDFVILRQKWLEKLPKNRAKTVLVEGIPDEYQSEAKLEQFFKDLFGQTKVMSAYLVKNCDELENMVDRKNKLLAAKEKDDRVVTQDLKDLELVIKDKQKEVEKFKNDINSPFRSSSGFVTFWEVSDATLAMSVQISETVDEWEVSPAPEPSAVIWHDLQQSETAKAGWNIVGYLLVAGLYMAYLPCVIGITQIAITINMGPLQPMWAAFAPTMGLQFMVAFLPTFLILIFKMCFTLKDISTAQQRLQNWYFVFQVVFVILITAIGPHMATFLDTLVEHPTAVFELLGTTMPFATHFYMNYLALQWASHSMVLMRYVPLTKFLIFRAEGYDDQYARQLAEPEDQDYYGIGSRSCRTTINLCIGLIYGTLSPPINVLTFIEFWVCKVSYGYLVPYAESKKEDLGGEFFIHQLKHLFVGLSIYCIVMVGVLEGRSSSNGPGIIALGSLFYVVYKYKKFTNLTWEKLSYKKLKTELKDDGRKDDEGVYKQKFMIA
jgi:hypothetical protein